MQNSAMPATAPMRPQGIVQWAGEKFGVDAGKVLEVLKATCFKQGQNDAPATDAEVAALLVVARSHGLNPFLREIYAFKDSRKGIVPIVGVDGWSKLINSHDDCDGIEFDYQYQDAERKVVESVTCIIHDKKKKFPTKITEFFQECYRDTAPWKSHPRRMLRHKALIQCGRVAFGFTGIFDEDEGERIVAGEQLGGIPSDIDLGGGGDFVGGADKAATRTAGLASELAKKARDVVDVDVLKEGKETAMTAAQIREAVATVGMEEELHGLLPRITALPPSEERTAVMRDWNAAVNKFKQDAEPTNRQGAPQPPPAKQDIPAGFAGTPEPKAPVESQSQGKPAEPKPAAKKPDFEGGTPVSDGKPTDADADKVLEEMKAVKTADELDLIADRENKRKWSKDQRQKIYDSYTKNREAFNS